MRFSLVRSPSTFDPKRRPIYVFPVARVTHKERESAYPLIAKAVEAVAERHRGQRILVHTVSYDLTRFISEAGTDTVNDRYVSYLSGGDRQTAIAQYLDRPGSILLAASLDRGIDLPGNDCSGIIVAKIPYPNLGDKQVSARLHGKDGQLWYTVQTIRTLVQMTGRGMRSEDDSCESYILDSQFIDSVWRKNKNLLPDWWREALVMQGLGRLI